MAVQRDYGDRADRAARALQIYDRRQGARLDQGRDRAAAGLRAGAGAAFELHLQRRPARLARDRRRRPLSTSTLFIENGRVSNLPGALDARRAARHRATSIDGTFRLTPNQNLIIADVAAEDRPAIEALAGRAWTWRTATGRAPCALNSIACVALPTCGLAMAESERYLPDLVDKIEAILAAQRPHRRADHHPHERLPERLLAALCRRDRADRPGAGQIQSLSRRRLPRRAPSNSFTPRISVKIASSRSLRPSSKPILRRAWMVKASVISSFG